MGFAIEACVRKWILIGLDVEGGKKETNLKVSSAAEGREPYRPNAEWGRSDQRLRLKAQRMLAKPRGSCQVRRVLKCIRQKSIVSGCSFPRRIIASCAGTK